MLVLQDVTISTDDKQILQDVNLDFSPGVHFIVGPNGAGKSTLAHAIMDNPKYTVTGGMALDDVEFSGKPTHERAQLGLFLSFQNPTPIEGLSNFKLVKETLSLNDTSAIMDKLNGFRGLAKDLNLPEKWDKKELNVHASGGEKKKNELIQMIMMDSSVVILDEPDSGLDVDAINVLIEKIKWFAEKKNKTVIIISHYEKLLKSFEPTTITIVANGTTTQTTSVDVVDKILSEGFKDYNES